VEKESPDKEDAGGNELNCHGQPPAGRRVRIHVLIDAIVDPKSDKGANLISNFKQSGKNPSDGHDG